MNKKKFSVMNIGSISLLMIFIILCMVILAALSLSSAAGNKSSADKFAVHSTNYYKASNQAEEVLDQIAGILAKSYQISPDSSTYFSEIKAMLSESDIGVNLNVSIESKPATLNYTTTVDGSQALEVELTLNDPWTTSSGFYTITSWKEVATSEWNADNSMKLIQ